MLASNSQSEVENVHSVLDNIVNRLSGLPEEQKSAAAKDLQVLKSCIKDLIDEKAESNQTIETLKASNQDLAAHAERYREITESIQDGLIVIDQNWQITFINSRAANNGDCDPGELIGRSVWEAFPRLQGTVIEENYRRVMAEKVPVEFEMGGIYQELWYHVNVYPSSDGVTVLWQDITERKQAEIAAQEHQKRLEQLNHLLDSAQEPIFVLDNNWNYIFANRNHHKNLKVEPGFLIGKNFWEVNPRALGSPIEYHIRKAREEGRPSHGRFMGLYVPVWYDFSVYPTPEGVSVFSYDRTEEVKAEKALQESEAALRQSEGMIRQILDSISDSFFELDNSYTFTYMNATAASRLGLKPEEVVGKNLWELYPSLLGSEQERLFRYAMENRQPIRAEGRGRVTPFWYEYRIYPSQAGITVYSSDITARKQTEQALQLALAQMRFYADSNLIGVIIADQDGDLVEANDYYLNLIGYTRGEFNAQGINWRNITPPNYLPLDEKALIELSERGTCTPYEKEYNRKDGSRVWVYLSDVVLPNGKIGAIVLDITERKRAEKELRQSEEQFARAFRSSPAGLTITRLADGRFIDANDSFLQMTGYSRDEVIGRTSLDLRFMPSEEARAELLQTLKKDGQVHEVEITLPMKSGELLQSLYSMVAVDIGGEACILSSFLDMTEMRRLEAQNIETKTNLEVQHRLVEQREQERQMIARDIHDGPIQSLVSTIFNIQMAKEALHDPKMQVELNQIGLSIKNTIQELRHLVNELRPPAVLHVGLSRMIRLHCTDYMDKHPEIQVDHELEDDQGKLLENSILTLYRIYQEAMNNIVRHANATHVNVRFYFQEDQAVLEIKDNGKGFDGMPDLISQTAKGHYGMAGMIERAEAANGKIQIQSAPGKGTTVRVMVPIEKEDAI